MAHLLSLRSDFSFISLTDHSCKNMEVVREGMFLMRVGLGLRENCPRLVSSRKIKLAGMQTILLNPLCL